ncbi:MULTISPECIES: YtrH family sporulation protein [Bacillaceae]|uniref:YtrH family sporulation protein n=1 Tax=Bacillaceae TaxID=186817 RepID=UPI001E43388B|nr:MULTISPECIES: YtrH family sporulation protein [Bacillaceae]MCE4051185.1 YtrH family sporulation protein [Bacillus sp. Au-Bac7]MCM3029862.1 YtrH family sporulation protein [Niallia sp. MER 6]MDL0436671.1 YtrH family sporulation protein [Niallia sp. SS-2023]UPO86844.1 YtrH family sporulation protein [Niallia sp. Man26]
MNQEPFFPAFIESYFIALGVVLGGALLGGLAAFMTGKPLLTEITKLSDMIRIWAIVTAIGGTFDAINTIEKGIYDAGTKDLFKQILLIVSAFGGAHTGATILRWITQEYI